MSITKPPFPNALRKSRPVRIGVRFFPAEIAELRNRASLVGYDRADYIWNIVDGHLSSGDSVVIRKPTRGRPLTEIVKVFEGQNAEIKRRAEAIGVSRNDYVYSIVSGYLRETRDE